MSRDRMASSTLRPSLARNRTLRRVVLDGGRGLVAHEELGALVHLSLPLRRNRNQARLRRVT